VAQSLEGTAQPPAGPPWVTALCPGAQEFIHRLYQGISTFYRSQPRFMGLLCFLLLADPIADCQSKHVPVICCELKHVLPFI